MSWYKRAKLSGWLKRASVTFSLNDAYKIAQPKNLLTLSHDLCTFIYKNNLRTETYKPTWNDISPDGSSDVFDLTGTINVYVPHGAEIKDAQRAIDAYIQELSAEGYKFSYTLDTSKMNGNKVFRLNVLENASKDYPEIPTVNMANGNAAAILRLIGIDEQNGQADLNEVKKRIIAVSKEEMQSEIVEPGHINPNVDFDLLGGEFKHDPADWWKKEPLTVPENPNPGKMQIMHGGRDENYIDGRLQDLYKLVDFGLQNGFKYMLWG